MYRDKAVATGLSVQGLKHLSISRNFFTYSIYCDVIFRPTASHPPEKKVAMSAKMHTSIA